MLATQTPLPFYADLGGSPLDAGYLYFGTASLNPETNPITVYWDAAGTQPAAQPIRTISGMASRNGSPAVVYAPSNYSLTIRNKSGTMVLYSAQSLDWSFAAQLADTTSASNGPAMLTPNFTLNYALGTLGAIVTSPVDITGFPWLADKTGTSECGAAIRAAIAAVTANGGQVVAPAGTYKIKADAADATKTAITIPSNVDFVGAGAGSIFVPAENNTVMFRMTGLNGGLRNISIDNPGSTYTGVSGIRLAPADEIQITTRSDVEFNNVENIKIRRLNEGIVLRCGPTVAAQDSYCYYNSFVNIDIRNTTLGIWLKVPNSAAGSGCNRNRFINVRAGETGCNTGLKIDAGDTNTFVGVSFEGIASGASPNATPTAVQIAYNSATYGCVRNKFYGLTIESCTRDVDNANDLTEFYGWYGTSSSLFTRPLAVDQRADRFLIVGKVTADSLDLVGTAAIRLNGGSATQEAAFATTSGTSGSYNGVSLASNTVAATGAQANTALPSWNFDVGGYNVGGGLGVSDTLGIHHKAAGAGAWTSLVYVGNTGIIYPAADNTQDLGKAAKRFATVYAGTGAINTSDAREKQLVRDLSAAERAAAIRCKALMRAFKFNDAASRKGEAARWHFGVMAQDVQAAFQVEGLDAKSYGLFCYDEWPESEHTPAGNRYGVRYEELLAFIVSAI